MWFQHGLARRIANAIIHSHLIATLQNLKLVIAAAEEIESKLDLSVKQAPSTSDHYESKAPECGRSGNHTHTRDGGHSTTLNNVQKVQTTNSRGGGRRWCPTSLFTPVLNNISPDTLPADASLHPNLTSYDDRFPDELPAELLPVRDVYHTIPLKNDEPQELLLSRYEITEQSDHITAC